ncbi:uncharacterized protein LOC144343700 [Saccoglossus kowalevskii]
MSFKLLALILILLVDIPHVLSEKGPKRSGTSPQDLAAARRILTSGMNPTLRYGKRDGAIASKLDLQSPIRSSKQFNSDHSAALAFLKMLINQHKNSDMLTETTMEHIRDTGTSRARPAPHL